MDATAVCPACGKPVVPGAPQGLCPECLMKSGFETRGGHDGKSVFVPPSVEEIARLFPQLEILALLGHGGMGAVYKARQPRLNRLVALKILSPEKQGDPQFAERFEREARTLAALSHPNIVTVYDFGEVQAHFYLLMEFVDGLTLRQLLRTRKISPAEALGIVPKICEALQFAHEHGVIHRDIKPENILLDKKGQVKIADFGIAKIMELEPGDLSLTGVKDLVGTPHYMAPEQIEKPQAVDGRADIYSLGVVFYEMLTGELPLGRFLPPSEKAGIDVRLDEVVLRSLEKEPERRYQQASEVKTDVETIAEAKGKIPAPAFASKKSNTGHWKVAALVGGFGVAIILLFSRALFFPSAHSKNLPAHDNLVALLAGEGNGNDSAGTNDATLTDVTFAAGKVGKAFNLNGRSSYLKIPDSPSLDMENHDGFTISAWIKPTQVMGYHPIVEWYSTNLPAGIGFQLRIWGGRPRGDLVAVIVDMNGGTHMLRGDSRVVRNRFQHVAVTYEQTTGTGTLFLDGQIVDQRQWRRFPPKTKGDVWISYHSFSPTNVTNNTFFAGLIDEIAIYDRALTTNNVSAYYNATKSNGEK